MAGNIHIGISGWSYQDWKGVFYPTGLKAGDWLTYYANTFDTTEINASFYRLPRLQTVINWAEKVPPGFKFCPKMNKFITHIHRLKEPEENLQRFFELFAPIKDHLGPVLVQLPPSLQFDYSTADYFFNVLAEEYPDYSFALEARHSSWLEKEATMLLEKYNIAWVISQSGVGFPYMEQVTAHHVYIRFHGPGKLYASSYTDDELKSYADKFKKWVNSGHDLWIYFNNCYYGVAIKNANTLKAMMGI